MSIGRRTTFGASLLTAFFILAASFAIFLYAFAPATPAVRGPILLSAFVIILIASLLCILFFLRWMLRPYSQLVGEAERAPIAAHAHKSQDEAQFVLETFQSIVAQLQEQQKELERLSQQASQRADSAERFSERIVASVPSGLIAFDGSGRSLVINGPGRALLEIDGQGVGQPVKELLKRLPQLADIVESCLQTGTLFRREEIQTNSDSGTPRRLGATVAPIDLSSERGALCLLTDITEVTQLREQVALKHNLESLGEMSAGLAHEFKNAIATLHGYAQLLQNLELDNAGRSATSSLLKEVRNLSEMVTAFLNFARPQPLQLEEVSLAELLDDCAVELKPLYDERRVELKLERVNRDKAEQLNIHADERMLRQALLNLLRNAAEAIPESAVKRQVIVASFRGQEAGAPSSVVVDIKDSGTGIPVSDLQRIFLPFVTTKANGHGIGLALTHRVITEHGGTLSATNGKDGGAIFTIRLPASPQSM
ncbi:MAG: ATP-binding protein [Acidobacteriota bacterium]|nr:ATP-binding protein [Acidobacteriota bacterium]